MKKSSQLKIKETDLKFVSEHFQPKNKRFQLLFSIYFHLIVQVKVYGLPKNTPFDTLKNRLNQICQSCGCKNVVIRETPKGPKAFIHFYNADDANRAKSKLNGEEIYNSKIRAFIDDNKTSNGHQIKENFHKNPTLERQKSNESKAKGQNNGRQKQQVRAMDVVPTLGSFGDLQLLSFPQCEHPFNLLNLLDQVNSECEHHRLLPKPEKQQKPRWKSISEDSNKPGGTQTNAKQMQNQSNAKPNQDENQGARSKREKKKKPKNADVCSVITGLETTADQSPEELLAIVRSVVAGWNNDDYDPEFVKKVERNTRLKNKNGKVALFVIASSQGANRKLVNGANSFGFNDAANISLGHYIMTNQLIMILNVSL